MTYTEDVTSNGSRVTLIAKADFSLNGVLYLDVWGRVGDDRKPVYPPRTPDKSIAKYGGIEGYLRSADRGLFGHVGLGQFLAFCSRARNHFALDKLVKAC